MRTVYVELGDRSYPIYIAIDALNAVGELSLQHRLSRTLAIITDETVSELYAERVVSDLQKCDFQVHVFRVPDGEESKSLSVADNLYEQMIKARLDRKSSVVALGGGVVGDLAGFVAATFLRGLPFVQIPTTLLAQTDSSVGGKVAVNHRLGKNLIGAFYQPQLVVIDPMVLKTLPNREIWAGMGEVIKYGLIRDKNLFHLLETNLGRLIDALDLQLMETIIENCCRIKAEVVAQDEREGGLRRILNFGHTIGHALEAATEYNFFRHGEAVIWGMRAMNWLSYKENLLPVEDFHKIEHLLNRIPTPGTWPDITSMEVLSKIYLDKKIIDTRLCVILLRSIGTAVIKEGFSENELLSAINYIQDEI